MQWQIRAPRSLAAARSHFHFAVYIVYIMKMSCTRTTFLNRSRHGMFLPPRYAIMLCGMESARLTRRECSLGGKPKPLPSNPGTMLQALYGEDASLSISGFYVRVQSKSRAMFVGAGTGTCPVRVTQWSR